ncbi:MAG: hemerythrin family protein [Planctomycetes bacterium]|nr:hemerythrin family protein [Planctomycetota bacterium]MCP4769916.1 hemerythrin family protein [Planctomycetota bacterium]MCP4859756.1 hemerythrin family protein [Planctomycetota bacterium]
MDQQHQRIVKVINQLIDAPDSEVTSELISNSMNALTRYAVEHFKAEEAMLAESHYSDLEGHRKQHKEYRRKVVELVDDAKAQSDHVPEAMLQFIRDWWVSHILEEDMKYRHLFEQKV